ncbi:hypothetical protein CEUSTIGMA_g5994.t1 [Chlamydomonas eustigma]|uniref:Uncharacterized protein n=1 Tax=Chlamydomonas eustigma TaxID=1157962 RepID=A0A250X648_9CHLO|nr:hypothetical protein CEUSTIGMA_g5994.t1 [Chlamydomonas eustigma]|eukprot:GAX78554.1 hypothetical protein CEUSTIGMA_g5994.t1 [Chlamydomonas eustigma]
MERTQYILRFNSYLHAAEHHQQLATALPGEGLTWNWIERKNKASEYPTDFGLINLLANPMHEVDHSCCVEQSLCNRPEAKTQHPRILDLLNNVPFVRDVHMDQMFRGKLNWVPEGELAGLFADNLGNNPLEDTGSQDPSRFTGSFSEDADGDEGSSAEGHTITKRSGRISTRFMMEGEDEVNNVLLHQAMLLEGGATIGLYTADSMEDSSDLEPMAEKEQHDRQLTTWQAVGMAEKEQRNRQLTSLNPETLTERVVTADKDISSWSEDDILELPISSTGDRRLKHLQMQRRRMVRLDDDDGQMTVGGLRGRLGPGLLDPLAEGMEDALPRRRRTLQSKSTVTSLMGAEKLWNQGFSGKGVKVGVFDTGIHEKHPHIRNIKGRSDWTHQGSLNDGLGHGSFVAGVIGSQDRACPGFAPDVDLYTFKVFTDDQVSFTSWFLDAFNYALALKVHVINLSIGGPDYMDQPFVDKILEITSNGILMVSAIGNDGPLWGTLNNPADQNDVIGVGGIDEGSNIAGFSSRGMTTWELQTGTGRIKPDIMAFSKDVMGSRMNSGCRTLSGTSVASPVVAGAVCLLASTLPEEKRWSVLNPASMKQALIEGADKLPGLSMFEQGSGKLNLHKSMDILQAYNPKASIIPAFLDFTESSYMWPYSKQPMYAGAMPVVVNGTVLNALGVTGRLEGMPTYKATDSGGEHIHMYFEYSKVFWPWSGYFSLYIRVLPSGANYAGTASLEVSFTVVSPPDAASGETDLRRSTVKMPVKLNVIPTPPRQQRLLWDQFHTIKYPPGYIPRDNLDIKHDVLDWHGDHLYTNFHNLYDSIRGAGYFIEILSSPLTCFDAEQYAAVIIVDPEEEFYPQEVSKLSHDVAQLGVNVIVFGEWYNLDTMSQMKFFDDNTRSWWTPVTGGSNVPALNDLLAPYDMAFGEAIMHGAFSVAGTSFQVQHGADVARMPAGSYLHRATLSSSAGGKAGPGGYGVVGVVQHGGESGGHVALYGDNNCLDSSHQNSNCFPFLQKLLERLIKGASNGIADQPSKLSEAFQRPGFTLPKRRDDLNFTAFSYVLRNPLKCAVNSPCEFQEEPGCPGWPKSVNSSLKKRDTFSSADPAHRTSPISVTISTQPTTAASGTSGTSGTSGLSGGNAGGSSAAGSSDKQVPGAAVVTSVRTPASATTTAYWSWKALQLSVGPLMPVMGLILCVVGLVSLAAAFVGNTRNKQQQRRASAGSSSQQGAVSGAAAGGLYPGAAASEQQQVPASGRNTAAAAGGSAVTQLSSRSSALTGTRGGIGATATGGGSANQV